MIKEEKACVGSAAPAGTWAQGNEAVVCSQLPREVFPEGQTAPGARQGSVCSLSTSHAKKPRIRCGKGAETQLREECRAGAALAGQMCWEIKLPRAALSETNRGPGVSLLRLMQGFAREEIGLDTQRTFVAAGKGRAEPACSA